MKYFRTSLSQFTLCLLFFLFGPSLNAQETIVTYFKKNGGYTAHKDSANYTSILRMVANEEGLYELNDYYANGNLKRHGWVQAANPRRLRFEGWVETYYHNGTLEAAVRYADNQRVDTSRRYYRNGVLNERIAYLRKPKGKDDSLHASIYKRLIYYADSLGHVHVQDGNGDAEMITNNIDIERGRYVNGLREGRWEGTFQKAKYRFEEWYENGLVVKGLTTDSLGKQYLYKQREVNPEYLGGMLKLRQFIAQNYRYPKEAIHAKVSGELRISFVVDTTGKPTHLEIVNDIGYGTAAAGIDVIRKSGHWTPGYLRGVPVRVKYTLPIRLNLTPRPRQKSTSP